ncbi:MAG: DUF2752 domain-containing protein [Planctomycetota bacterium]
MADPVDALLTETAAASAISSGDRAEEPAPVAGTGEALVTSGAMLSQAESAEDTEPPVLWKPWRWFRCVPREEWARRAPGPPAQGVLERIAVWLFHWLPIVVPAGVLLVAWLYRPYVCTGPDLCGFHRATGIPCPTCGMTRSFCFLAHGEWAPAFGFNGLGPPLFVAMVAWMVLTLLARLNWLHVEFRPPRGLWVALILILFGVYAVRLTAFFVTPEHIAAMQAAHGLVQP